MLEVTGSNPVSPTIDFGKGDLMRIAARDLRKRPIELKIHEQPEFFDLKDKDFQFLGWVKGQLTIKLIKSEVFVQGFLEVRVRTYCVRCLSPVEMVLRPEVNLIYAHEPRLLEPPGAFNVEEDIIYYYDGELVEPGEELRELIMAELPHFPLCREDCRGLCPQCGVNLNKEGCKCKQADNKEFPDWKKKIKQVKLSDK